MDQAITRATGAAPSTTPPATARRTWAILLTSANHGVVGPLGSTFPHAGEHHERVQVVELVEAGAPPAPDVDLAGLLRFNMAGEPVAIEGAAPVAAQAGQVAVPEGFVLVPLIPTTEMVRAMAEDEWQWEDLLAAAEAITDEEYSRIAAAPSPAVAQQAPAQAESAADALDAARYRWLRNEARESSDVAPIVAMMDWQANVIPDEIDCHGIRSGEALDRAVDAARGAQASTSGERKEGGQS